VLVVDDEALVRAGFRMVLGTQPDIEVVGEAANGLEGVEAARALEPDVVLMDVRMPRLNGIEATRAIVASESRTRVIVLTTFDEDEFIYGALEAGASGFLLKDTPPEELADAVRLVATGDSVLHPSVTRKVVAAFVSSHAEVVREADKGVAELTERELEVFVLMGQALSNAEISTALFNDTATTETHVARVFMKLGLRDRAQAVVRAYECGLIQPGA
jgi:DNA-binding NarL/FixJ family response regulator